MRLAAVLLFGVLCCTGCGIYSFSGSSLPSHLKTVTLPLVGNQSMEPDVADELTRELNRQILADNLLRIVSDNGDATILATVVSYTHEPFTFGAASTRQVDVDEYIVKVRAEVEFYDNVKDAALFKETLEGQGKYDFTKEVEVDGRKRAVLDLVQRILQSSLQGW